MGRPRTSHDEEATRTRILRAAELEFGRAGRDGARLEDIAGAAGITRPSLLYHFPSKDDLYAAVVEAAFLRLGAALAPAMEAGRPFEERLDALTSTFVAFVEAEPLLSRLLLRDILDERGGSHALLLEIGAPLLDRVERFIRREGKGWVREGMPVRAALMQLVSSALLRVSSGSLREPLWGRTDGTRAIARALFLGE
ncbi:MAG: TetR/AcrR family transcriptional regulator [Polyangiaceae bacterium]|nr:TetR/AcrR family transcriptional regulator [Polyangiaceae bacterium]